MAHPDLPTWFPAAERFDTRHIGPSESEVDSMLQTTGVESLQALIDEVVPTNIRLEQAPTATGRARSEVRATAELRALAVQNIVARYLLGGGYSACVTPPVIQRNILENPGWYTQYTPYQSEIAQGRLEAILNFQTMVSDLTGLPVAGASLLDEATASAEAMAMCFARSRSKKKRFFVDANCHEQTLSVVRTRARGLGIELIVANPTDISTVDATYCGALFAYPDRWGAVRDLDADIAAVHDAGGLAVVTCDLLALVALRSPGKMGADICVGNTQRFGMPLGYGGPHAGFLSTVPSLQRKMPGRIVGVSVDRAGKPAYRLAIQTREQHIRRERATSNICTAQVLPAIVSSMYAVHHGAEGLRLVADRVRALAGAFAAAVRSSDLRPVNDSFFDTVTVEFDSESQVSTVVERARAAGYFLRQRGDRVSVAFDERSTPEELRELLDAFELDADLGALAPEQGVPESLVRKSAFLEHPVFREHRTEHKLLRYMHRLQGRDLSLTTSMIPLGSCTMKLNATSQMAPISWPEWADIHPHAPAECTRGYAQMLDQLGSWLSAITGMDDTSLQPNSGANGEYAGLLAIRGYHEARGEDQRDVCLIPVSAHGTNPASAAIAGMRIVAVACDDQGNVDTDDLRKQAEKHAEQLAALMITYPSTHGVFEEDIREVCEIVHGFGGQVYMDGANMNAQVGLTSPGHIGADVCHLNLHKTFCIPHGGGGPGMGPICVKEHLAPFLPVDPSAASDGDSVSAAMYGSALILVIPWMYIRTMGDEGLKRASSIAILSANYMGVRLSEAFDILYTGANGRVGHEFIVDCRPFKKNAGIEVEDIAKRLMDYGFHAPTMSFPVPGTLMIEPTESESKDELDRFCDAMLSIRAEIARVEAGTLPPDDNPLVNAPHSAETLLSGEWGRAYEREEGAYPLAVQREFKFWPATERIDNGYGDRNLICTCPSVEEMAGDAAE